MRVPSSASSTIYFFAISLLLPVVSGAQWVALGPEGGATYDVMVDNSNSQRVLVSTLQSGIFESNDRGLSFARAASSPAASSGRLDDRPTLLQHPLDASRIVALGRSLFVSDDGGLSWTQRTFPSSSVLDVRFNANGSMLFAASPDGLFVSTDFGNSWQARPIPGAQFGISVVWTSPSVAGTLFVRDRSGILFRSTDAGNQFTMLTGQPQGLRELIVDDAPGEPLFASTFTAGQLHRSTDGGETWTMVATDLLDATGAPASFAVLAEQTGTNLVMAVTAGRLYRTDDGGNSWQPSPLPPELDFPQTLRFDRADYNRMYIASEGGLFVSSDGGGMWQLHRNGIRGHRIDRLSRNRIGPVAWFAEGNGVMLRTETAGATWSEIQPLTVANDGLKELNTSGQGSAQLFGSSANDLPIISHNAGATWNELPSPTNLGFGLTLLVWSDPRDDQTLIAGDWGVSSFLPAAGLYRSTDGGATWARTFESPADRLIFQPHSVVDHPSQPGTAFFGIHARTEPAFTDGLVLRTVDGGATFEIVFDGMAFPELAVDASGILYAAGVATSKRQGIWRSLDGGDSWHPVNAGLPLPITVFDIDAHPLTPGTVVFTTSSELYASTDAGASWLPLSRVGLREAERAYSVMVLPDTDLTVLAGTTSGVFRGANLSTLLASPVAVPTLTPWLTALFAFALLVIGASRLRRRDQV